jgi:uncharacterized protein (TIGR02466 family)|tara:strand:+ start:93 stop:707 length:615 start_codon:yes stop_codon:yes gene_type:complete
MVKINRLPIFTSEVFSFELPNFEEWQKQIKQIVMVEDNAIHDYSTTPKEQCNVMAKRTAWNSHTRYSVLNLLSEEIKKHIKKFVDEEGYNIPELTIKDCWINWYSKDEHAQPHTHNDCLSVVFFVDVEKTNANLFFHKDDYLVLMKTYDIATNFSHIKQLEAKDGTVIFFDGSMRHSVSANKTENKRITVAINFYVTYNLPRWT